MLQKTEQENILTARDYKNIKSKAFNFALNAFSADNYNQYEETEFWADTPKQRNIESNFLKKDKFKALSREAQEVIKIVLECPQELLDFAITPQKKLWSPKGVQKYIKQKFGKKSKQILPEIHKFLITTTN